MKKKDTRRARGNAFELWCAAWLTENGWSVHRQQSISRPIPIKGKLIWTSPRNDILGCADLVAVKPGERVLFVQCTLDSGVTKREEETKVIKWDLSYACVQLWADRGKRHIQIKQWTGAAFVDVGKIELRKCYMLERPGPLTEEEHERAKTLPL